MKSKLRFGFYVGFYIGVGIHLGYNLADLLMNGDMMALFRVTSEVALLIYLKVNRNVLIDQ